jgi:cytochrome c
MKILCSLGVSLAFALALVTMARVANADGDAVRGEKKFEECIACHAIERGGSNLGPSLYGVFDRKAGELTDFRYSPALKRSGIVWTAQTLDAFIASPQATVPANRMPYAGMPDADDRADLIAFLLKTFR